MYRNFYEIFSELRIFFKTKVLISKGRCCSAAWSPVQKTILKKIRFINIFQCAGIFADCCSQCLQSNWSSLEIDDQSLEDTTVNFVNSAKSLTRFNSRFARRGVPRERLAISAAPFASISTPNTCAERSTIVCSSL